MNTKIFWKYFAGLVLVAAISLLAQSFFFVPRISHYLNDTLENTLLEKLDLAINQLQEDPEKSYLQTPHTSVCRKYSRILQARVTFLAVDLSVVCDSEEEAASNLATTPELLQAQKMGQGRDLRSSKKGELLYMYVARPFSDGFLRVSLPARDIKQALQFIIRSVILASILGIIIAVLLGWVLSRRVSGVVNAITLVAEKISGGDLTQRVTHRLVEEMKPLALSINHMADNLQRQHQELTQERNQLKAILEEMREAVIVLDQDDRILLVNSAALSLFQLPERCTGSSLKSYLRFTALDDLVEKTMESGKSQESVLTWNRIEEERHLAVQTSSIRLESSELGAVIVIYDLTEIYRLENFRRDFVANVSHELKTPLTSILGYAETLSMNNALEDKSMAAKFLGKILRNAEMLKNLVNDLLKLSQLESGRLEIICQPMHLLDTLGPLIKDFSIKAESNGQKLQNLLTDDLPEIMGESTAIIQVFSNLIDNAIKYTPSGGTITISAYEEEDLLKVSISDTGVGIPEDDLARIFERFYRVDKARSRDAGGTGLGLSIVKHLLSQLEAALEVKSEPGKGSTFTVALRRVC